MDKWKRVRSRKEHECESCLKPILKGEIYDLLKCRVPRFDDKDNQIGIEYIQIKCHIQELHCYWPEECKKGNHIEVFHTENHPDSPNYGDSYTFCELCGTDLSDIEQ